MYDISNRSSANMTLERILQINDIRQEWYLNGLDTNQLIKKFKKQIQVWDLTKEEFLVKHITSSIDKLGDICRYGLLSLSDVLTKDTTLKKMLNKYDISFDIENEMLFVCGHHYDLNKTRRGYYDETLGQIHRAIYSDYLSTMLYKDNPWYYGSEIYRHPEFMIYLASVNENCKEFVDWWKKNSIGYMITAKVPFEDVYFESFGYGLGDKNSFIIDSKHKYQKSKEYLIHCAINVLFDFSSGIYLFIDKKKRIKIEQFIKVEEKDSN